MKKFSDFAADDIFLPTKRISEILDTELVVEGFEVRPSKHPRDDNPNCVMLKLKNREGLHFVAFTSSLQIQRQLERYKDELPFEAKIRKVDKWLSLA